MSGTGVKRGKREKVIRMYGITKQVDASFDDAFEKTRQALQQQGFGVLTEIDIKEKLKEKIGVEMDDYIILGACNPPLAHKALQAETEIGLLLPCNVIVYVKDGKVFVSAINPEVAMGFVENSALKDIAAEVKAKLEKVIESL